MRKKIRRAVVLFSDHAEDGGHVRSDVVTVVLGSVWTKLVGDNGNVAWVPNHAINEVIDVGGESGEGLVRVAMP